jgi:hypothetical protein
MAAYGEILEPPPNGPLVPWYQTAVQAARIGHVTRHLDAISVRGGMPGVKLPGTGAQARAAGH